jgi:hypothetical protein
VLQRQPCKAAAHRTVLTATAAVHDGSAPVVLIATAAVLDGSAPVVLIAAYISKGSGSSRHRGGLGGGRLCGQQKLGGGHVLAWLGSGSGA